MNVIDIVIPQDQRGPDYGLMKRSKKTINMTVARLKLGFAEYLQSKVKRLDNALNETHAVILQSTVAMMPLLRGADFLSLTSELQRLDNDQSLEVELRAQILVGLKSDYLKSVNADAKRIQGFVLGMKSALNNMKDIELLPAEDDDATALIKLEQGIARNLDDLGQRIKDVEGQRNAIDDLIKLIDDKNLIDHLLPWIPSASDLQGLSLSTPEIELLKKGLDMLSKHLEQLSEYIRYNEMVKVRDDLRAKHKHYLEQKNELNKILANQETQIEALTQVKALETVKLDYLQESEVLVRRINDYASAFNLAAETSIDDLRAITERAATLYKILEPIASAWRAS